MEMAARPFFCYVDDLVDGLVKMARATLIHWTGQPWTTAEITADEVAKLIKEMTGSSSRPPTEPASDDPRQRKPDISLAESKLGWYPKFLSSRGRADYRIFRA